MRTQSPSSKSTVRQSFGGGGSGGVEMILDCRLRRVSVRAASVLAMPAAVADAAEILGGIRLSKTQQIIIKIVCAVVILFCIAAIFGLIDKWRNPSVEHVPRVTYVNQEDKPRKLIDDAVELARSARAAEQGGSIDVAFELITKAKESAEEARDLITVLAEKHPGETYWKLHSLAAEINKQTATINSEAFRLEMQVEKAGGGE